MKGDYIPVKDIKRVDRVGDIGAVPGRRSG